MDIPRLELFHSDLLYDQVSLPVEWVALISPLRPLVYFSGEGVITVRPFVVSLSWLLVGVLCTWIALRRKVAQSATISLSDIL
jgi:hypothetical protein